MNSPNSPLRYLLDKRLFGSRSRSEIQQPQPANSASFAGHWAKKIGPRSGIGQKTERIS